MSRKTLYSPTFEPWRLMIVIVIMLSVFGFYLFRLFNLQILQGAVFQEQAYRNRTNTISIPTQRGVIYDRNGFVLAQNVASYNVVITPAYLPEDDGSIQEIYRQLSQIIGVPVNKGQITEEIVKLFTPCANDLGITQIVTIWTSNYPYEPVRIKCNVDAKIAMIVREKASDWPGVGVEIEPVREYPTGELTSEIIGFQGPIPEALKDFYTAQGFVLNRDKVGYAGIEDALQSELQGKNGTRVVAVDVAGQELSDLAEPVAAVPGNNVVLTIDTRLQSAARTALISEINFWNVFNNKIMMTNGVVIAMNPKTGEILAMVSYPNYENNRMARIIPGDYYTQVSEDPNRPLLNHAISAEYPPGSVFKMAAAIGALNEGVVTPDYIINDPGLITIAQKYYANDPGRPQKYVCWKRDGHGKVDFLLGVANSCDVYFYKIGGGFENEVAGDGLGPYRMPEYARALGYDNLTGIELNGEVSGLIPDPKWKRLTVGENWATGDTYIATIGQGYVLATPLQVLLSFTTIANNGKMMKPTLVKEILDSNGKVIKPFIPVQVRDITKDPVISVYDGKTLTGEKKSVAPWVLQLLKQSLRLVVTDGTSKAEFVGETIKSAGKTGTAEYCDNIAQAQNRCQPENWPAHAWYVGYAPYDDPEIAVVAFVYNGTEGSTVSGPIVRKVLDAYFELKAVDAAAGKQGQ